MSPGQPDWFGNRDEFCGLFIWEISARSTGINPRNTTNMVEHKLVSFAAVVALWTLVTLLIKHTHTPKVEIQTRQKLCHFGRYVAKARLFCLTKFFPGTRAGMFISENFRPDYGDLGR